MIEQPKTSLELDFIYRLKWNLIFRISTGFEQVKRCINRTLDAPTGFKLIQLVTGYFIKHLLLQMFSDHYTIKPKVSRGKKTLKKLLNIAVLKGRLSVLEIWEHVERVEPSF